LLGADGGGFLAFKVRRERRAAVCNALRGLIQVSVDIDPDGSWIMVYEPNDVDDPEDDEPFWCLSCPRRRLIASRAPAGKQVNPHRRPS
jgi:hypothetical protein